MLLRKKKLAGDYLLDDKEIDHLSSQELAFKASMLVSQAQDVLQRLNVVLDEREQNEPGERGGRK